MTKSLYSLMAIVALLCTSAAIASTAGQTEVLNAKALPLGDGLISTQARRGYVFACATEFRTGGSQHAGDWIQGATWDATRKIWVQGDVAWPNAQFSIEIRTNQRILTGNALPVGHTTGIFPIARTDPAFQIDRNPNPLTEQLLTFALPLQPTLATNPSCLPMGAIGVAINGVPIFNALDAAGLDAVAHEVQDRCHGHPQGRGIYHYHGPSDCVAGASSNNTLVGYALDGFGIYSNHDESGKEITNSDLDECHGRTSPVMWNGKLTTIYHYVMTRQYPYTLGCYRGTAVAGHMQSLGSVSKQPGAARATQQPGQARHAPPAAVAACTGQANNSVCSFTSPRGRIIDGNCRSAGNNRGSGGSGGGNGNNSDYACIPANH